MHRVVPELVLEHYRAGRFNGEFPAVGMFLDLYGFSTMTEALMQHGQHGAEVLAGLMHGVFDPIVTSIFEYGGKIVGFAGDAIMALYSVEGDAASTALRAFASAQVIQQRLGENPARQTVYGRFPISAKIGLSIGTVSWGILQSADEGQATYYFRGSAVDDSADAEHHAQAGDILFTASLHTILQEQIQSNPLAPYRRFSRFSVEMPPASAVVFPPIDVSLARVFMPESVIAEDVRGEFRQVVNLFMRFPDLPHETLREFMRTVFDLRGKYGGLLNRLDFGDKGCNMLMLWGAPTAYENDIGRALNFLLDLRSKVDFPITAGVTYYIAHAGYLGSALCEDYTCYGWGVNLAARFMMGAPTGQIWVDDRIFRRVSRRFEMESVGAQMFKGFSDVQKVYLLRGYKQTMEVNYQGELVGRENELAQLAQFAEPLWRGKFAGLTLISGDAGIGKGRLVHEFRASKLFESNGVLWAVCQSDQLLRHSFNPIRGWLLKYFGIISHFSADERRQAFDSKLNDLFTSIGKSELADELQRTCSVLGALVDIHWPDSLYEQLDAEGRYNNTFLALISLLRVESLRQPVLLFLEDIHFTDTDSRDFLSRLKRAIVASGGSDPIAIIATSRPHGGASLEEDLIDLRIVLGGLSPGALSRLSENLLGGPAAENLVKLIVDRSEGNPYFAEQILRYLQDEKSIEMSRDGWAMVRHVRDAILPGDIGAILVARLDQLAREVRDIVQTASVLGREFEIEVLARMLRENEKVQTQVTEAEKAAIWAPLNEIRYIFSHGLLRDAAYRMQMRARRQELHALAVDALESLCAGDAGSHFAELAYHAEHADLHSKAQRYYALAGKASADSYQNNQAVEYLTRALAFTPFDDLGEQFDLLIQRVELFNRIGERDSQAKDLLLLAKLAEQLKDRERTALVQMLHAYFHNSTGNYPAVDDHARSALELCDHASSVEVALDTYTVWAQSFLRRGRLDDAMKTARKGLELAQKENHRVKEAYLINAMGLIALEQRNPAIAKGLFEDALSMAREAGDRILEGKCLNNLGNSTGFIQGDHSSAQEYYGQAYEIFHERGDRSSEGMAQSNLGWVAGMQGDIPGARSFHKRALAIAREVGNAYQEAYTLINLSAIAGIQGEAEESLQSAIAALELSQKVGDKSGEAWSLLYLGNAYLLKSDLENARDSFQRAAILREQLDQPGLRAEPSSGLIRISLEENDMDSARLETESLLAYLANGGTLEGTEEPLRVYLACYQTLRRSEDPRAAGVLREAGQMLDAQLSRIKDEESRRRYVENVPWRREIHKAWQAVR